MLGETLVGLIDQALVKSLLVDAGLVRRHQQHRLSFVSNA